MRRGEAQAHLLVRATADDPVPPRWETHPVGLEELVLANLREPGAAALPGPGRRRVVPAIAATLTACAGLALATALYLRQHYMTPLLTSKLNLPGSAWIVSQWYTKGGKFAFPARGSQIVNALQQFCPSSSLSPAQCLSQHGYTWWARHQPGSRFWPFQWIEGGWLLALSVLLIAATVWLVRRRAA